MSYYRKKFTKQNSNSVMWRAEYKTQKDKW